MPIRSQMSSIMVKLKQNIRSYLPLNLEKLLNMTLFTLNPLQILTNQHQNLVKMYVIKRSHMSLIMDLIGPELSELSALELENLPYLTLFTLKHLQILTNKYQTWPQYILHQVSDEFDYGTN